MLGVIASETKDLADRKYFARESVCDGPHMHTVLQYREAKNAGQAVEGRRFNCFSSNFRALRMSDIWQINAGISEDYWRFWLRIYKCLGRY
jgi:hypothetical protein